MIVNDHGPGLIGESSDNTENLWDYMNWQIHYVSRGGISNFGISALDIALWDLFVKNTKYPLWKILGELGKSVNSYAGLIDLNFSPIEHEKIISTKLNEAHKGIKIKIGLGNICDEI